MFIEERTSFHLASDMWEDQTLVGMKQSAFNMPPLPASPPGSSHKGTDLYVAAVHPSRLSPGLHLFTPNAVSLP